MAGRNDRAIADALQALAQAIGNPNRGEASGVVEYTRGWIASNETTLLLLMEDTTLMVLRTG